MPEAVGKSDACTPLREWMMLGSFACVLTACGGAEPTAVNPASSSGGGAATGSATAAPLAADKPAVAPSDRATAQTPRIEVAGEVTVDDASVERTYWVDFTGGPLSLSGVTATLVSAGPQVTIIDGTIALDELPAGVTVTPVDTITVRLAPNRVLTSTALQWKLSAAKPVRLARLLDGPAGQSAVAALRNIAAVEASAGRDKPVSVRFAATLKSSATVGQVNSALSAIGARIVGMRTGDPTFSFEVADSERVDVQARVVSRLDASDAFDSVTPLN